MNIAFVSNVVYPFTMGGAEKRIYEIGRRLAVRGHEVTIYARHFWDGPPEREFDGLTLRAVSDEREIYTDDRRSIPEAIEFAAHVMAPLRRHIKEHDLIVASVFPYFPVFSSKLASVCTDVPLVTTWHEVWGEYWDEYLGVLGPFGKLVERMTAKVPQHPVAVSEITAQKLAGVGPRREQITTIPNGIDFQRITAVPAADRGFDVLFAGRLIREKNISMLLSAFDRVADGSEYTLGIIGDGPVRNELEQQATSLSNSEQVSFLGFVEEEDALLGYMHASTVFASPSTREGFGISLLEAMAADCTVIGVEHPNSAAAEVIGDAGLVCRPTVGGVAEAIRTALDGYQPPVKPSERAKEFDWGKITTQSIDLYNRVLENPESKTSVMSGHVTQH